MEGDGRGGAGLRLSGWTCGGEEQGDDDQAIHARGSGEGDIGHYARHGGSVSWGRDDADPDQPVSGAAAREDRLGLHLHGLQILLACGGHQRRRALGRHLSEQRHELVPLHQDPPGPRARRLLLVLPDQPAQQRRCRPRPAPPARPCP